MDVPDIQTMKAEPHETVRRLMIPAAIATILLIAAIMMTNFYLSLILGVAGAALFAYSIMSLMKARKALAGQKAFRDPPKSPPPE